MPARNTRSDLFTQNLLTRNLLTQKPPTPNRFTQNQPA